MGDIPRTDFDLLEADIHRQPELLARSLPLMRSAISGLLPNLPPIPPRIYLTGCGDSLSVGLAVRLAWERLLGSAVQALPAMEFSRYQCAVTPPGSWLVALSQSGSVVRVQEALRQARRQDLFTLAVTSRPDSGLVRQDPSAVLYTGYKKIGFVPGTSSYTFSLALYLELAAALARDPVAAQALRAAMNRAPDLLGESIDRCEGSFDDFVDCLGLEQPLYVLASGPNYANACYAALKFAEITGTLAVARDVEEYAHDVFYLFDRDTPVLLLASPDRGFSRSLEVASWLVRRENPLLVITSTERARFFEDMGMVIGLPDAGPDLSPLLYAVPIQMLAAQLGRISGWSFYHSSDPFHYNDGDAQIYESRMDLE